MCITLAIICPHLLINGIDVTIFWARLAKCSKEISCSRNLVAARDFYDAKLARCTFYASSYEILVEKKVRDMPLEICEVPVTYLCVLVCVCVQDIDAV